jgi:glycosyltransferase involved in cell wall biosynthesis
MRVLVLSDTFPPYNLGGAGEVAHLVSRRLAERGHEVLVVAGVARPGQVGYERRWGLSVRRIWAPVPAALRLHLSVVHPLAVTQVVRIARAFRPDAVHAHNLHERLSFAALAAARVPAAPVVLTAHDYLLFCLTKFLCSRGDVSYHTTPAACPHCRHIRRVPWRNAAVHALVRRNAGAIACISRAQRTALAVNGYADVPLDVVYNGLDPLPRSEASSPGDGAAGSAGSNRASGEAALQGAGAAFRARFGLDERPLVLFGGRISGAKGGDQLLRAVAHARRRVDGQLAILGDRQAYFDHARRLAAEVGLDQGALRTLGWLEQWDLDEAFAAAEAYATPSVYPDPFNLMTLRAMAHGKPVVGTCYGGTPEIVVDGETGFVADPWQPEQFGDRLADLLLDGDLARRLGEAGRTRMESTFTLDKQVDAYERLYARVRTGAAPDAHRPGSQDVSAGQVSPAAAHVESPT